MDHSHDRASSLGGLRCPSLLFDRASKALVVRGIIRNLTMVMTMVIWESMTTITKSRLKAEMLGVFRKLERNGGELIVTDRGRPVLKISPLGPERESVVDVFADVSGKAVYREDIMKPATEEWGET